MSAISDLIEQLEAETVQRIVAKCVYCVREGVQVNDAGLCSVCAEQLERATVEDVEA